ncbi:MAG: TIGR01906 family membrane protein [Clostridiales bacterium]|nr:TIGR01906 family membrane protein [Clostridiales bacterium]
MKRFKFTDFIIGIIFTLLLISMSVVITINFRPLYYLDVEALNIEATSGYPKQEILDNYNALINYSSPFYKGSLSFPTLSASENGLQHFKEVKDIFTFFYILGAITLVLVVAIILYKRRKKDYHYLLVSSITTIVLPIIVALAIAIDFDTSFVIFHKIFFNNDYWIFDPTTDPVIKILPDTFFMHCALLIIFFVILGSILLATIYFNKRKKIHIKYRKSENLRI